MARGWETLCAKVRTVALNLLKNALNRAVNRFLMCWTAVSYIGDRCTDGYHADQTVGMVPTGRRWEIPVEISTAGDVESLPVNVLLRGAA